MWSLFDPDGFDPFESHFYGFDEAVCIELHAVDAGLAVPHGGRAPRAGGGGPPAPRPVKAQLRSSKLAPQLRQLTVIFPFPRGTRRYCPQLGHLK